MKSKNNNHTIRRRRRKKISATTIRVAMTFLILSLIAGFFLRRYLLNLPSLKDANEYTSVLKRSEIASKNLTDLHQKKRAIDFSQLERLEQITTPRCNTLEQTNNGQNSKIDETSKIPVLEGTFFGANSEPLAMLDGTLIRKGGEIENWELIEIKKEIVRIKHTETGDEHDINMYKGSANEDKE